MAKITIAPVTSGYLSTAALNEIFDSLEAELNSKVLYRDNPVGEPNQMENAIDMNSNRILNVANAVALTDAVNLGQLEDILNGVTAAPPLAVGEIVITQTTRTATAGQTVFTIPEYTPNVRQLAVYRNGQRQYPGSSYNESSTTTVTMIDPADDGDVFLFSTNEQAGVGNDTPATLSSTVTSGFNNNLSIADDTVQKALDTLDNLVLSSTLGDLTDVDFTTPPTEGQTIIFDSLSSTWIPGASGVSLELVQTTTVAAPVLTIEFDIELSTNYLLEFEGLTIAGTANFFGPIIGWSNTTSAGDAAGSVITYANSSGVMSPYGANFLSPDEVYPTFSDFGPHCTTIRRGRAIFKIGAEGTPGELDGWLIGERSDLVEVYSDFHLKNTDLGWEPNQPRLRISHLNVGGATYTAGTVRLYKINGVIV